MDIIKQLNWRYATKSFSDKKISENNLNIIKESARLSATSFGLQAIKLIIVENKEIREALQAVSWGQHQVTQASHLLVLATFAEVDEEVVADFMRLVADTRNIDVEVLNDYKNIVNSTIAGMTPENSRVWLDKQAYILLGTMMSTCALLEIDSCPMEGFDKEAYDEILGFKALGLRSVAALPVGYRSDDDKYQHLIKVRRAKEDFYLSI